MHYNITVNTISHLVNFEAHHEAYIIGANTMGHKTFDVTFWRVIALTQIFKIGA